MIFFERFGIKFGMLDKSCVNIDTFLFEKERKQLKALQHPNRKIEFIGARQLRNEMIKNQEISYLDSGKPYLKDSKMHISISHSDAAICLCLSQNSVGIDIEIPSLRSVKVASKFCSDAESKLFNTSSIDDMTTLWSIKESIYKKIDEPGLDFKKCIRVLERGISKTMCVVKSNLTNIEVLIGHEKIDNQFLTFTIE
ncbi:MAG: 4'-phosphopantetheinyl transferase superfamily protein [Crocinitomicaceae bacterium]|nr:4'-phosphopantetheinyl transferase superfamily protein [Crocinitomicaceae bacterium]